MIRQQEVGEYMATQEKKKSPAVADVESFMKKLDHPYKAGIGRLRAAIKSLDSKIVEEIKKTPLRAFTLDDPHKLLTWPAIDRCVLTLQSSEQAEQLEEVVTKMVKQWIQQL
jgi:hypothetical protein